MQAGKSGNQPDKQFFQPGTGGELTEPDEILCSDSSFQGNRAEKPAPKALVKPALFVLPPGPKKSQDPRSAQFRSSCKRLSTFRKDVGENVQVCTVRLSVRFHTGPSIAPPASHGYEWLQEQFSASLRRRELWFVPSCSHRRDPKNHWKRRINRTCFGGS